MKIYGLYGKSGTGKSYQAMNLCRQMDIESIIDDGLFIHGNLVAAGISAKRQKTKIGAVRTALFTAEEHANLVKRKIKEVNPKSILVLGTSYDMILKIVKRLDLPKIDLMIPIESITTENQREAAKKQRKEMGKHVIPAPTFQIKRQFSGYFLDPLRIFRGKGGRTAYLEKTVVRPTYSYLGEYDLSDKVITDIVVYLADQIPGIASVSKVFTINSLEGVRIQVFVLMQYGAMLIDTARELQKMTEKQVENMTAFNIIGVDVEIRGVQ